jgi:hypothetical protein
MRLFDVVLTQEYDAVGRCVGWQLQLGRGWYFAIGAILTALLIRLVRA